MPRFRNTIHTLRLYNSLPNYYNMKEGTLIYLTLNEVLNFSSQGVSMTRRNRMYRQTDGWMGKDSNSASRAS